MRKTLISTSLFLAIVASVAVERRAASESAPRRIEIIAKRFNFEPGEITLIKGEPVVLVLKSADVSHGLRIREVGLEVKASKERPGEAQFTPQKDGDFVGHCSVFCGARHGSMSFTLHVVG
jgi:cytochrome c oxidase subunit II